MANLEQILVGILRIEVSVSKLKGELSALQRQQFRIRACQIINLAVILILIGFFFMAMTPEDVARISRSLELSEAILEAGAKVSAVVGVISLAVGGSMFGYLVKKRRIYEEDDLGRDRRRGDHGVYDDRPGR